MIAPDATAMPAPRPAEAPRLRLDGTVKLLVERAHTRLMMGAAMLLLGFAAVGLRLVDATMLGAGSEPAYAHAQPADELRMERADIVDRNGTILATNLPTASLYADPKQVLDPEDAARRLVRVLPELSESEVLARLRSDRRFVWLRRHLTPQQKYAVNRLGVPGLYFQREERRVYPKGRLAAHVLGFTNVDNRGLAGIERHFDEALSGGSEPLALSIDIRAQHVLTDTLQRAIAEFRAIGAAGVVLDVRTGEIIAMASLPDYDPNEPAAKDDATRFNRATLGVYEMGSTFKALTAAMALDAGTVSLSDGYDARQPLRYAGFTIDDYKPKRRWLSVPEIFIYSSNIGAAKMALDVGIEGQKQFLGELGLLQPASLEVPEIGQPIVPETWRPVNAVTIAFGHGISVTPVQLANAVAATVNGGILRPATLLRRRDGEKAIGRQVISPRTSDMMRGLMRLNVTDGSGSRAEVAGYLVGGKTGSAEKIGRNGYSRDRLLSSFVGAFPMNDPRYLVLALIDEPKGNKSTHGYATGGWVAAPVVHEVVARIAPMLGVHPAAAHDPILEATARPFIQKVAARGTDRAGR